MSSFKLSFELRNGVSRFATPTGFAMSQGIHELRSTGGRRPSARHGSATLMAERLHDQAVTFRLHYHHQGPRALELGVIRLFAGHLELAGKGWQIAHSECFKREDYFDGYGTQTGALVAALPGFEGDLGLSEDWPFPGLCITHPERGTILMATLTQTRCKPCWTLRPDGKRTRIDATERFTGTPCIRLAPGASFTSETWVMLAVEGGVEDALDAYFGLLRERQSFRGETSILRRAVVWGSWNYNRRPRGHADITHAMVLANARALKTLAPRKPRVVMIDDGYQFGRSRIANMRGYFASCMECFHPDGHPPHDPELFPRGLQGIADDIRKAGAIPALWTTIRLHRDSALAKDRPEWLMQTTHPQGFGVRSAFLDYSLPEVREFTRSVWHTIFNTWGFRGLKLDFWSMPFEIPQVRFRNTDRTAVEWRNLFLQDLREAMPREAFLLLCVVTNSGGNPFVGAYADAARMGCDIGDGKLETVGQAACGLTVSSLFYRHNCLLGDPDSIGWSPDISPGQNRLWASLALLTGGMCEIGGDLTDLSAEQREFLRVAIRAFQPRLTTRTDLLTSGPGGLPAHRLVVSGKDAVYVGELNWGGLPREIRLPAPVRDLWSGRLLADRAKIPPYDAVLYRISKG